MSLLSTTSPGLFWARAFSLNDARLANTLVHGPTPHPDPTSSVRLDETALGIAPPRVYFYLNQLLPEFGETGVLLRADSLTGELSPFDSGGLLDHIIPVKMWPLDAKRAFLRKYTFDIAELGSLLGLHPGDGLLASYQRQERPTARGPHAYWGAAPPIPQAEADTEPPFEVRGSGADIWRENDPRAWYWEARPAPQQIVWTIVSWSSSRYPAIMEAAARDTSIDEVALGGLVATYRDGGASRMLQEALSV